MTANRAGNVPVKGNGIDNSTKALHTQPTRSSARRRVATVKARSSKQLLKARIEKGVAINNARRQHNAVSSVEERSVIDITRVPQDVINVAENTPTEGEHRSQDTGIAEHQTTDGNITGRRTVNGFVEAVPTKDDCVTGAGAAGSRTIRGRTARGRTAGALNVSSRKTIGAAKQNVSKFVSHATDLDHGSISPNSTSGSTPHSTSATASDSKHAPKTKQGGKKKNSSAIRAVLPSSYTVDKNENKSDDQTVLGKGNRLNRRAAPSRNHDIEDNSRMANQQGNDIELNALKRLSKNRPARRIPRSSRNGDRNNGAYLHSPAREEIDLVAQTEDGQQPGDPVEVRIQETGNDVNSVEIRRRRAKPLRSNNVSKEAAGFSGSERMYKGKNMVEWLASLCLIIQTTNNERNESNKYVREKLNIVHDEVRLLTEVIKTGFADICLTITHNQANQRTVVDMERERDRNSIQMDLIDACTAIVKYAYALAAQGKGSPLHFFPCRITQEKLFKTVMCTLLESSSESVESIRTNLRGQGDMGRGAGQSAEDSESNDEIVERLLSCRVIRSGKDTRCIFSENYGKNGKEKNTILDRILDHRRRFHEAVTLPLVFAWLRYSWLTGYDSTKSLKKQSAEVFEAAADALERDEKGNSGYLNGKSYRASCMSLLSTSETYGENALGYVKKLISDDEELAQVLLKLEVKLTVSDDGEQTQNLRQDCSVSDEFYPYQLAFVFTKISARLQSLSKCNIDGGCGRRQIEKGHAQEFLANTINFDSTLRYAMNNKKRGLELRGGLPSYNYSLLGVPVKPLSVSARKRFESALNGRSTALAVFTTVGKEQITKSETTVLTEEEIDEYGISPHSPDCIPSNKIRRCFEDDVSSSLNA